MSPLEEFLEEEIAAGSFPGGSALVGSREAVLAEARSGQAAVLPHASELESGTLFDLASLTKPLAAGALAFEACREGLDLASPPGRFLPQWKKTRFDGITIEMLLTHTSGLAAWFPLYARGEGAPAYRRTLGELEPEAPPGSTVRYSDLGFLVLAEVLEAFFASRVDRVFADLVALPEGSTARFLPEDPAICAATEEGDETERVLTANLGLAYAHFRTEVVRGDVHDGNAFRRGGVSAHAGLFATAEDVWRLARSWLDPARGEFTRDRTPALSEARGLGWQGSRGAASVTEGALSESAFGHTGFTGTSVWLDPERERIFVLLTNRIHPRAANANFNEVRRRFHDRVREL
ncbi:MAG: beta-lactamase family protein [Acidobacteriota bacterium]|nr:beta-lactamase family protein [Acidobacteriota bacterium]